MKVGERKRKIRSDKKVDVKPTLPEDVKTIIYLLADCLNDYVKNIAEDLCVGALSNSSIIGELQQWLRRDYLFNTTLVLGEESRPRPKVIRGDYKGKITIKFKQKDYDRISELAHALDITPTTTCAVLLMLTTNNRKFMIEYLDSTFKGMDKDTRKEAHRILRI